MKDNKPAINSTKTPSKPNKSPARKKKNKNTTPKKESVKQDVDDSNLEENTKDIDAEEDSTVNLTLSDTADPPSTQVDEVIEDTIDSMENVTIEHETEEDQLPTASNGAPSENIEDHDQEPNNDAEEPESVKPTYIDEVNQESNIDSTQPELSEDKVTEEINQEPNDDSSKFDTLDAIEAEEELFTLKAPLSNHTRVISEDIEIFSQPPSLDQTKDLSDSIEQQSPELTDNRKIEPLPAIRLTSEDGEEQQDIVIEDTPEMTALKLAQDLGYDPNLVDDIMLAALSTEIPEIPEPEEEQPLPLPSNGASNWTNIKFHANKNFITDQYGRQLSVRGVALGGNCRVPNPNPSSSLPPIPDKVGNDSDALPVTFEDLPFPLHEAEEHFERLKLWGMTIVRLVVPWEAIEHAGPGIYDDKYIDYLVKLCNLAGKLGFKVIIDPRQEAWSRHCGGSGAPAWTLEVAGLDSSALEVTAAAYIDPTQGPVTSTIEPLAQTTDELWKKHADQMWMTNHNRLACSTMYTLFFAGSTFAPCRLYKNQFVQEYLQMHYCNSYQYLAKRLNDCSNVIGFFTMPNINTGYIGLASLSKFDLDSTMPQYGLAPTPLQGMALAEGVAQNVPVLGVSWTGSVKVTAHQEINSEEIRAWLPGISCPWREAGAWDMDPIERCPKSLDDSYFCRYLNGSSVNFPNQYFLPFINRFIDSIRNVAPDLTIFISPIPNLQLQVFPQVENVVYCPSFYDLNVNTEKKFDGMVTQDRLSQLATGQKGLMSNTYLGLAGAKKCYQKQIGMLHEWGQTSFGQPIPMLIGEMGIPFNLNQSKAYQTGDFTSQSYLLDCLISAVEENHKGVLFWHYQPNNSNEHGDHYNHQDYSIISKMNPPPIRQEKAYDPLFVGGRCLESLIRPYAAKVAGQIKFFEYYPETGEFHLEFTSQPHTNIPIDDQTYRQFSRQTEIHIPTYHYRHKTLVVHVSDGIWRYEPEIQTLYYWHQTEVPIDDNQIDQPKPKPKQEEETPEDLEGLDEHEDNFHSSTVPDPDPFELIHDSENPDVLVHSLRVMIKEYAEEQEGYY